MRCVDVFGGDPCVVVDRPSLPTDQVFKLAAVCAVVEDVRDFIVSVGVGYGDGSWSFVFAIREL